jgi:hypothetical protein
VLVSRSLKQSLKDKFEEGRSLQEALKDKIESKLAASKALKAAHLLRKKEGKTGTSTKSARGQGYTIAVEEAVEEEEEEGEQEDGEEGGWMGGSRSGGAHAHAHTHGGVACAGHGKAARAYLRLHTSAEVSIRQHTSGGASTHGRAARARERERERERESDGPQYSADANVCDAQLRQHTSAYAEQGLVRIRTSVLKVRGICCTAEVLILLALLDFLVRKYKY